MEVKAYKPAYKCGICDKEYETISERMKCEQACLKKQEEEAKKAAEAKKKKEQNDRKAEVDAAFENLHKLVSAYVEDYGYYSYDDSRNGSFNWPSRLWNNFWN